MNNSQKIIDLFAGCGGLSKGFEQAGFQIAGFVENWLPAIDTHQMNFPNSKLIGKDITQISDDEIIAIKNNNEIKGIIGGPPCQGFSTIGKRDPKDPRNSLFMQFIRFVKIIEPDFFVMENVRGLVSTKNEKGVKVLDIILQEFKKIGYNVNYKILCSADYGVPQVRERLIFIGHKNKTLEFPSPTHKDKWLPLIEAIQNLPKLDNDNLGESKKNIQIQSINSFQKNILGVNAEHILLNHQIIKQQKIDLERGIYIPEGRYFRSTRGGLKNEIFPREELFLSKNSSKQQKYCKLDRNLPSWTVLTDWYTMRQKIHPFENRPFSIRELARIQTFPDNFIFTGNLKDQYKQIGNAVPVLLAKMLAQQIKNQI
jgi:DNA (cytosine-5)-methyltransferase 1